MLKNVVLTGASSDLGMSLLRELSCESSSQVIATMRRQLTPDYAVGSNVRLLDMLDLTNPIDCDRLAQVVDKTFLGPFAFVHCVGDFWEHVPFEAFDGKSADQMFESHVMTLYNSLQSLVPLMRSKGGGSVVTFSCNSVRYNYPWMAAFTASKSAVDSLVRSLANEFSGEAVRLNSLVLASVKTPKVKKSKPNGDFVHYISPQDIFPVVKFLLSAESRLINGNTINLFEHSDGFYNSGYFQRISK